MILLVQNEEIYNNDFRAMIQAFYPGVKIVGRTPDLVPDISKEMFAEFSLVFTALFSHDRLRLKLEKGRTVYFTAVVEGDFRDKKHFRNKLKLASYRILSEYTGRELPWGSLTGVRPTKIAMAALNNGREKEKIIADYERIYDCSYKKAKLATDVAIWEKELTEEVDGRRDYCLYVGIPFCPSRCLYCSFASYPIASYQLRTDEYVKKLQEELRYIAVRMCEKRLVSVYFGGGTPTALTAEQLDVLLTEIENDFDMSHLLEYTVEAGRPDSITKQKLEVLKRHDVSRISINPQTMHEDTLRKIGRAHSKAQVIEAFQLARACGFDNINMDLIAGLPGENISYMEETLAELEKLNPESITVHSLAIKRAARLKEELSSLESEINHDMDQMLDLVQTKTEAFGMAPYYLYRQKNIGGNLENVGYAKPGKACYYNILIMEEMVDIIGAGAGSSTKVVFPDENRVERCENCKSLDDYLERFDEMLARKDELLR